MFIVKVKQQTGKNIMLYENVFDFIVDGYEIETDTKISQLIDITNGMAWSEIGTSDTTIGYGDHVLDNNGVGVYYDIAADYYFFVDLEPVED